MSNDNVCKKATILARVRDWVAWRSSDAEVARSGDMSETETALAALVLTDGRREALEALVMAVVRYNMPGFAKDSPMHERIKDHIPWLIEEGYLDLGKCERSWVFNRGRIKQELGL